MVQHPDLNAGLLQCKFRGPLEKGRKIEPMPPENTDKSNRSEKPRPKAETAQMFLDQFDDALRTLWRDGPSEKFSQLRQEDEDD